MLEAFESVGVRNFSLTRTDINRQVVPGGFRPGRNIGSMRLLLPVWVNLCWKLHQNLVLRAQRPVYGILAQLDDLNALQLDRVRSSAFLSVETSPQNFQAWLMIEGGDAAFAKRLMKEIGSDSRANCSGRVAGSPNVKLKYAPDFPMVKIVAVQPGCKVAPGELESLGLVAPPVVARAPMLSRFHSAGSRGWPDYDRCLRGAPPKADGSPDRSRADFMWSKWAIERNNSLDAVRIKLLEVSEKARQEWERGNRDYVRRTVDAAASGAG